MVNGIVYHFFRIFSQLVCWRYPKIVSEIIRIDCIYDMEANAYYEKAVFHYFEIHNRVQKL